VEKIRKFLVLIVLLCLCQVFGFSYTLFQSENSFVPGDLLIVEGTLASGTKIVIRNLEIYPVFTIQWLHYLPDDSPLRTANAVLAAIEMIPFALLIFQDDVLRIQLLQNAETDDDYHSLDYSELISLSQRVTENRAFAKSENPLIGLSVSDYTMISWFINLQK
jgi:hypothetical protein